MGTTCLNAYLISFTIKTPFRRRPRAPAVMVAIIAWACLPHKSGIQVLGQKTAFEG